MTCQTGPESSKFHKANDDSTKVVNIDYKKVGHLNLEVLCSICQKEVHISQLFHHKKTHQAQAVLDYRRPWVEPIDMEKIAHRRKKLILKRRMAKYPEREREKIDCAVDLLKESLKIAPYFCIKSVSQSSVHIQEVSNPLIKAIAVCQDKNAIWNIDLEDVFVVLDNYGNRKGTCFLGLFDGSNGISAARTASAELPLLLLDQLSHGDLSYQVSQAEKEVLDSFRTVFRADYIVREKIFTFKRVQSKKTQQNKYEWIHRAYAKSFWRMDQLLCLGRNEVSRVRWSSCAAAICLVEKISNEKQEEPEVGKTLERDKKNIQEEEQELPERIRAKKRSCTEMGSGRGPEQQREPLERINDKKEQNIVGEMETPLERVHGKEEQNFVEKTEDPLERKNDEKEENIIEQREDPLESISDGEERTNTEEREDHLGSISDGEEQTNTEERKDHLGSISDGEEQTNTEQREDHLESISDGEEQTNTEEREDHLGSISDEKEQNNTEQRVEPAEIINDEKEENVIEQREDLLKRRKSEKEQGITQQKEESFEIINDKKEPYLMQEESQLPERISGTKEKIIMGSGTGRITGQQQEEPLETINDGKENNIGDNKQIADNKEIKEGSLLENNTSSDEVSVGLMHIANIGNVHAVLCKNGKSYWLTKEHSTYSREEKIRVFRKVSRCPTEKKAFIQ
ncbi:protein phosphatase 2C-like domain-containing protein 1 isoform X2 [Varanus komodoensis]|uniref:protein phosphatase 2C-like domain-containing protein 1 isoform X2 n=1 Tax=Varanus komodoensis TaxID=61221 RepID=UPI001CF796B8|nr:protein phosphatase 2C-like domain-containing protein 1 isoform X2 [Varanus komodoensis]